MKKFKILFGIKDSEVKKCCVLLPCFHKGMLKDFGIECLTRGRLYASANSKSNGFTLIHTGIGPGFVGDAVLYLKQTSCENLILFGSCGLTREKNGLSISSLVSPFKCYAQESFSSMLLDKKQHNPVFYPDKKLLWALLENAAARKSPTIRKVTCASITSLKLEEERQGWFENKAIEVVDMECSAFFSAAEYCRLRAVSLFYVSDIIKKTPFYVDLRGDLKSAVSYAIKNAIFYIRNFLRQS